MTTVEEKFYRLDACDGCNQKRRVRRLPTSMPDSNGSTSAVIVCIDCWNSDMSWRRSFNRRLSPDNHNKWPVWHFYDPSPFGDVVEFGYDAQTAAEKQAEVLIFDDLQMSACKVAFDDPGNDYAILNKDGDAVAFAENYQELTELVALWRKNPSTIPSFDKLIVEKDGKPIVGPFLSDEMAANPRLILLWDRVSGSATFDHYIIWIVYPSRTAMYARVSRNQRLADSTTRALQHAEAVIRARSHHDYVVVVLPNIGTFAHAETEKRYATMIGEKILAENKQAFAERGRTK